MLTRISLFALAALIATVSSLPALSTQLYEWRDPATGKLMLGDKPPDNIQYWEEGQRKPGEQVPKPIAPPRPVAPPTIREATDQEVNDCLDFLKSKYSFKDQESLRVEGDRTAIVHKNGNKIINISVNGKNSYGAYAGAKLTICQYLSNGKKELFYGDDR